MAPVLMQLHENSKTVGTKIWGGGGGRRRRRTSGFEERRNHPFSRDVKDEGGGETIAEKKTEKERRFN